MLEPYEVLPSGKMILRQFGADGQLVSEMHAHGMVTISLTMAFRDGVKVDETYIVKNRMASRSHYEKARVNFPDMPVADTAIKDTGAEMLKFVSREQRERRKAKAVHTPDPNQASQVDAACVAIMQRGRQEDATAWLEASGNSLGELTRAASRRLVKKLLDLGCKQVLACEIDPYENGCGNTGHLVVELPEDSNQRKAVFREIGRKAARQGFEADPDDGQRYAYVKLD
jgi:hypothetical protein